MTPPGNASNGGCAESAQADQGLDLGDFSARHGKQQLVIFSPEQGIVRGVLSPRARVVEERRREREPPEVQRRADVAFLADVAEISCQSIREIYRCACQPSFCECAPFRQAGRRLDMAPDKMRFRAGRDPHTPAVPLLPQDFASGAGVAHRTGHIKTIALTGAGSPQQLLRFGFSQYREA